MAVQGGGARTERDTWRAVAKWVAGIVAAVLGSVLTYVIIKEIDRGPGPVTPTSSAGSPTQPPSYGPLTTDQLTNALLDLGPDFTRGQPNTVAVPYACSDPGAAVAVLGDKGRTAGPVGVSQSRSPDPAKKDRIIDVREDLASYGSGQDAADAMTRFAEWMGPCKSATAKTPLCTTQIQVNEDSVNHQGDATSAASVWTRSSCFLGRIGPSAAPTQVSVQYQSVVVVQLRQTVCVLAFSSVAVQGGVGNPVPPSRTDVNSYIAEAVKNLKAVP